MGLATLLFCRTLLKGTLSHREKCQIVTISAGLIQETNTQFEEAPNPQNEKI